MPVILTRVIDAASKLASKLTEQNDHVSDFKKLYTKAKCFIHKLGRIVNYHIT